MGRTVEPGAIETPREPVSETYHGVTVTEDYRWLEDAASDRTKAWTDAQNERTRSHLHSMPFYDGLRARVEEVLKAGSVTYNTLRRAGTTDFALKRQPPKQQPFLVSLTGVEDLGGERVLVDPNEIDRSGATTIDWYDPSRDGALIAVSLSSHGTEDGTVHVFDVATGAPREDSVPRVTGGTAGGSLAWAADSSGFWYTRYPSPGERPEADLAFYVEVWFHRLGQSLDEDRRELAGVFADDRIAEHVLTASPDGRWVMDRVQKGDGGDWQVFVRAQDGGAWWPLADIEDKVSFATFGPGSTYLLSRKDAPHGRVLRLPMEEGATVAQAVEVVSETAVTIEGPSIVSSFEVGGLAATDDRLWVLDMDGGMSSLRLFDLDGNPQEPVDTPPMSAIDELVRLDGTEVAFPTESLNQPKTWWRASAGSGVRQTALATRTPLDVSGIAVTRDVATSADGTRVPLTIAALRDTLRGGSAPTVLYGYGGYGIALKPWFNPSWVPWLEQGGVVVLAHVRGGGEYGEEWHHAGRLLSKQNVFDDFAACAAHLVTSGLTTRDRLAVMGGSNGGLLVGGLLTQHPDLIRAVVAMVPVMDMLRVELHPNGAFNVTEFGTVADPDLFRAMYAYSPYHRVEDGVAYPSVLLTAGEFDPRVDAYHAKKMAARLQAATSSGEAVLLRIEASGHGMGTSLDQQIAEMADEYAFLFDRLGVDYKPVHQA